MEQKDWYEEGKERLIEDVVQNTCVTTTVQAEEVYSYLSNIGLIDYDVEKEVIWDRYFLEGDDEELE